MEVQVTIPTQGLPMKNFVVSRVAYFTEKLKLMGPSTETETIQMAINNQFTAQVAHPWIIIYDSTMTHGHGMVSMSHE